MSRGHRYRPGIHLRDQASAMMRKRSERMIKGRALRLYLYIFLISYLILNVVLITRFSHLYILYVHK